MGDGDCDCSACKYCKHAGAYRYEPRRRVILVAAAAIAELALAVVSGRGERGKPRRG